MDNPTIREITVAGAGEAGLAFIKSIREKNKEIKITLIEKNKCYFDKNKFITSLNTKEYSSLADFAQDFGIELIQETLVRVNPERRKVYFKEKEPRDFQTLVVACGLKSKNIAIKGEHREGFFYLADIELFAVKDLLRACDEVVGYVSTILGLRFACALKTLGKEVRVLADSWEFLGTHRERAINFLQEKGIAVHLGVAIEEVIGEGQVKATKINPLKVFSSQLVFIDSGFTPNLGFFEEGVQIKDGMAANYQGIYVIGDAGSSGIENDYFYAFNQQDCRAQGISLAESILGGTNTVFQRKNVSAEDRAGLIEELFK